jgi:hypothetical protein
LSPGTIQEEDGEKSSFSAERLGGVLGLPVSFVIGCDGRIHARHTGPADVSLIEQEIMPLLQRRGGTQGNTGK